MKKTTKLIALVVILIAVAIGIYNSLYTVRYNTFAFFEKTKLHLLTS